MRRLNKDLRRGRVSVKSLVYRCAQRRKILWLLLLTGTLMLSACGGSGNKNVEKNSSALSGNWQFTMTSPDPNYPATAQYGLQGGFLLESTGTVTGQALYSVAFDQLSNGVPVICNSGSATITGTVSGQNVALSASNAITLTVVAGAQTFQLTGTVSSDGSTMNGQFTTTGGGTLQSPSGPQACGAPTSQGASWTAISVPPLTGSVTGSFHSTGILYSNQEFQVSGALFQGSNTGASSATVNGSLSFINPTTLVSDYPCFPLGTVNVSGQISGNTVILQLIGIDGSSDGQIGVPASQASPGGFEQVTYESTAPSGDYMLHSAGLGYQVNTKSCGSNAGEQGYVCLALNKSAPCQQPITLSPAQLIFSPQLLVCTTQNCSTNQGTPTAQTITLTNNQPQGSAPLTNLTLQFAPGGSQSDFTGLPDFAESDGCSDFLASSRPGQSCQISITFAPQESCPWAPTGGVVGNAAEPGIAANCPLALTATLTIGSPTSTDNDTSFALPITGTGLSYVQASVSEVDFGAEAIGESSPPQLLSFTNQSAYPVQVLGPRNVPCKFSDTTLTDLPRPLAMNSGVGDLQVATSVTLVEGPPSTVGYFCDTDQESGLPNFQFSADTCTGTLLAPEASCSVEVGFVPQPKYSGQGFGLDYFLEFNTVQCDSQNSGAGSDCEIDGGRFPVELKANGPSPLRILPAAGLNFGNVSVGTSSTVQYLTLFNDPADPLSATVNFSGRIAVSGSYSESDDCPFNLSPGASCTLTVKFKPSATGFNPGLLTMIYTLGSTNATANPQYIYLRGTGQ
jgi:hypothetical protein